MKYQAKYPHGISRIILFVFLALTWGVVFAAQDSSVFTYDGKDFIRATTTLVMEDGKSAVNTKLDQGSPAYKALIGKHSYLGEVIIFGQTYDAYYAPLTDGKGKLTGALFVGNKK